MIVMKTDMDKEMEAAKKPCIFCGKPTQPSMSYTKVVNHKTIYFCNWKCKQDWDKRTTIGEFDILGETLIKGVTVKVFCNDGSVEISNPNAVPVIEVTLDIMTFDSRFAKGATRKNHVFYWEGKIPDKFKPLNRDVMEAKIKELIDKAVST